MDVHEVLVAARNLIDREGWGQGGYRTGSGYCVYGACGMVTTGQPRGWFGVDVYNVLIATIPEGPAIWNDAPGRTKEEVLAAFDKAINATAPEPYVELSAPVEVVV